MKTSLLSSIFVSVMLMTSGICNAAGAVDEIVGNYKGSIIINLGDGDGDPILNQKVSISKESDTSIRFTLFGFNFAPVITNEDIVLDNVPVEKAIDGTVTISNETYSKDLVLGNGLVEATVKIDSETSYVDGDNILVNLNIIWNGVTIMVKFEGVKDATGIAGTSADSVSPRIVFNADADVLTAVNVQSSGYQIYNFAGKLVKSGNFTNGRVSVSDLSEGIYLIKTGALATKIVKN